MNALADGLLVAGALTMVLLTIDMAFKATPSKKAALIILLIIALNVGVHIVSAQQHPANKHDVLKDNYHLWEQMSKNEKVFYLWGFISGTMAMGAELAYNSGYVDLLQMAEEKIPEYDIRSYIAFIDWVYEEESFHKVPMYLILMRADYYTEERYNEQ